MTPAADRTLDRIRKLLALARGKANEHEAAAAAAMAADLMARHQIDEAEVDVGTVDSDAVTVEDIETRKRRVSWRMVLLQGAAESVGCKAFITVEKNCDAHGRIYGRPVAGVARIIGRPSDIQAARYVYDYLVREVDGLASRAWEAVCWRFAGERRAWTNSFRLGAATTIRHRLNASRRAVVATSTALVKHDAAVAEAVARLGLQRGPNARVSDGGAFAQGVAAGHAVRLGGAAGALGVPVKQLRKGR